MTAGRRLAAIMAVDVVGYSRLMGVDEAGTARAVREHREAASPIVVRLRRQNNRRRLAAGVSLGRRGGGMRDRNSETHDRAKCGDVRTQAHHLPHWRQPQRRVD
jgi:hypothetical protein